MEQTSIILYTLRIYIIRGFTTLPAVDVPGAYRFSFLPFFIAQMLKTVENFKRQHRR